MSAFDGLLVGFAFAAPIGTQNIFVISSAMQQGLPRSFRTAATVSAMDATLAIACFFGVGAILDAVSGMRSIVATLGAFYVFWVALCLIRETFSAKSDFNLSKADVSNRSLLLSAFLLTWVNPHAIIDGTIILGGQRAGLADHEVFPFVFGMVSASILWFFILTTFIGSLRSAFSEQTMRFIQLLCALAMMFIGYSLLIKSGVFV